MNKCWNVFHLVHVLLLVCRRYQRNQLLEVNRRNYDNIDNQPQVYVELNNQGERQPLVVDGPAEEEQQLAEGGQQPAEGGQEPAEEEEQPWMAGWRCQIL